MNYTDMPADALNEEEIDEMIDMGLKPGVDVDAHECANVVRLEWTAAADRAWDNLRRYKFSNFGYYAARVVFLGQLIEKLEGKKPANPFKDLVLFARERGGVNAD